MTAFLFPGQGAQYLGMGKDFFEQFPVAKHTFEEADDLLGRSLSSLIFEGDEKTLTETRNSQVAIYVVSTALQRVVSSLFGLSPSYTAGLSLGEYTALTAAGWLPFQDTLPLVQKRGTLMAESCDRLPGTMAVVIGLEPQQVEDAVASLKGVWVANYNCPGQIVLSGTVQGVEQGSEACKKMGAKRVLPLQVHGAFHSGLMQAAREGLTPFLEAAPFVKGKAPLVVNVSGKIVDSIEEIKASLIAQVTEPVRWEKGIRALEDQNLSSYIEFGPGKTLSGMNKRIGTTVPTLSIEKVEDLTLLEALCR